MGKADRNRRLRAETRAITASSPSAFTGIYRRAKKLGSVAAVIEERIRINESKKPAKKRRGR